MIKLKSAIPDILQTKHSASKKKKTHSVKQKNSYITTIQRQNTISAFKEYTWK